MPTECAFILPTGHKCRCLATREHRFCRHHGAPRQKPHPSLLRDRWSRLACWRDLGRSLQEVPLEDVSHEIIQILHSLLTNRISDRTAGRFLRILLQRCGDVPVMSADEAATGPAPAPSAPRQTSQPMNQLDNNEVAEAFAMIEQLREEARAGIAQRAAAPDHLATASPVTVGRQVSTDGSLPSALGRIR